MNENVEELIRAYEGTLIVQLTDPTVESSRQMESVVAEVHQWEGNFSVLRLDLSLHREWARRHDVHGVPCTLVFHQGRLCCKARGRFGRTELRELLTRAGLLENPDGP